MAISDASGLPIAANVECASPHEITLVKSTIKTLFTHQTPEKIIGDKAYDSDTLDHELKIMSSPVRNLIYGGHPLSIHFMQLPLVALGNGL